MLFNQSDLTQTPQGFVYGLFFADAAFPCNRLSRRKCNAGAAVAMLAKATVDGNIAWLEVVLENFIVDSKIGFVHNVSLSPSPHREDLPLGLIFANPSF